jgi:TorA maturation chaperone TorD
MNVGLGAQEAVAEGAQAMAATATPPDDIDAGRAQSYLLLATLLSRPPDAALLRSLSGLRGDGAAWGEGLDRLAAAAAADSAAAVEREHQRLFIGVLRGELVPYASYYVTGFLHDRPLVAVRQDMDALGIARRAGVGEPEDHIAALLEIMAGLIDGRFGSAAPVARQRAFFERHLLPWAPTFFRDLEKAEAARFYRPVGALGLLLLEIERQAFEHE